MTPGSLEHLPGRPDRGAVGLNEALRDDGITVDVAHHEAALTVLDVRFAAPPADHLPGYPDGVHPGERPG
jgi:hypothetical protein